MQVILVLLLLIFGGCKNLERGYKTRNRPIKTNNISSMSLASTTGNKYALEGRNIVFYSKDKPQKKIDVITKKVEVLDNNNKVVETRYSPREEVVKLRGVVPFKKKLNFFNSKGLITKTQIYMYDTYNSAISYTYDDLLRVDEQLYTDTKGELFTRKAYSYREDFHPSTIETYDRANSLVSIETFSYKDAKLNKLAKTSLESGRTTISTYSYKDNKISSIKREDTLEKYYYNEYNRLSLIEKYKGNQLIGKINHSYDDKGRLIKIEEFSNKKLTTSTEYIY